MRDTPRRGLAYGDHNYDYDWDDDGGYYVSWYDWGDDGGEFNDYMDSGDLYTKYVKKT